MITKPMLAATVKSVSELRFPLLATPKLDGIRCLRLHDGRVVTRTFKPIPNRRARAFLEETLPVGADGEIYVPGVPFNEVSSAVMNGSSEIEVHFAMFDFVKIPEYVVRSYANRMMDLQLLHLTTDRIHKILPIVIPDTTVLAHYEQQFLDAGYEGVMLRSPGGPYKLGRSTLREQYLMKFKRMEDSEAIVIGFEEKEHNDNPAEEDAFGRTKRSTHQANKRLAGTLGALVVRDVKTGVEFNIGTGFTDEQRQQIWDGREKCLEQANEFLVCYCYQVVGTVDKPRFPSFKGWRHVSDT